MADDTPSEDCAIGDDDDEMFHNGTTLSTKRRWKHTGTIVAIWTLLSLPVLLIGAALGIMSLAVISQAWFILYGTVCLMAATWLWGRETLDAVSKAKRDGKN